MNLNVYRNQVLVGRLSVEAGEPFYGFTYDPAYLALPQAMPVSLSLPLQAGRYPGRVAQPYFEGLLPEGDSRDAIARRLGISSSSSTRLLEALGRDCAGDISILAEQEALPVEVFDYAPMPGGLRSIADSPYPEIARLQDTTRLSLAGRQEKVALFHNGESLEDGWFVPLAGAASTHIVKPGLLEARYPHLTLNEFICLRTAAGLGLKVANVDICFADAPLLVVERYDRVVEKSAQDAGRSADQVAGRDAARYADRDAAVTVVRLHQEDCCQALGVRSDSKYEGDGGPGFRQVRELLARHGQKPFIDIALLARLAIFNYLTGNCDNHAKNISLLHNANGTVSLAPAYDIICTTIYDGSQGQAISRSMGMAIGSHLNIDKIDLDDLLQLAGDLSIQPRQLAAYAHEIVEKFESSLTAAAAVAQARGFTAAEEVADWILRDSTPRARLLRSFG